MFEIIRANQRRSVVLVIFMLGLLLVLGFVIGAAVGPSIAASDFSEDTIEPRLAFNPTSGIVGMGFATVVWLFLSIISYWQGDRILMASSQAHEIEKADHPQLFNVVEEMSIAAALPKMPRVYIIDSRVPNAFAAGRNPDHAVVAVTAGLLGKLDRDELQGVIAHEVGHIVNRDVLFMTMLGVMLGAIVMISELFLRSMRFGTATRSSRRSKDGGGAQLVLFLIAVVFAMLAPIFAQLIYFAASRRREYLADASGAVYTRYPDGLARALEKIAGAAAQSKLEVASRATAPMYIINPLQAFGGVSSWFSTHPPTEERIRILRSMGGNASYASYQAAWKKVDASGAGHLPASALAAAPALAARAAHPNAPAPAEEMGAIPFARTAPATPQRAEGQRLHQAADVIRRRQGYRFAQCGCGMRFKVPPGYVRETVNCPRCGALNTLGAGQ